LILLFLGLCYSQSTPYSGNNWQSLSAAEKEATLTAAITSNTTSGYFLSPAIITMLFQQENMNLSFDTVADDLPYQFNPPERRPKIIHAIGVIANAVWTPVPNSYTGIFSTGCDGFIRLSLSRDPDAINGLMIPSISIKCLRPGKPSVNMFAMNTLMGQESFNFFKHDLTNHLPDISFTAPDDFQQIRAIFATASNFPVMIGLSEFAQYDKYGNTISCPLFPFRLVFHPTKELNERFPDNRQNPWQEILARGLQTPGDMYYIYAEANPGDEIFRLIGTITTTSPATTSNFGDREMFFAHVRMERDFQFRPEWEGRATQILADQRALAYNYTYPDLSFNNCCGSTNCYRMGRIQE